MSAPTSTPAWDRTWVAVAKSKALNHYPEVAAYFRQVLWCAGFSTGIPPSIEAAEHGALSGLLVMRCLRGVWRRRIVPVEERLLGLGHCV